MEYYKSIIISDVHLGIKSSKAKELVRFLKEHHAETLILNGDIIDAWQLKKRGKWKKKHSRFFKLIMKFLQESDMEVVYIRGNHDDFLDEIIPFSFNNFSIVRDYIYTSHNKSYYVCHGDLFDSITTNLKWLAHLGDVGYTFLLWVNRLYNNYRIKRGLKYYSLSQKIKNNIKTAVSFISDFEETLVKVAATKKCTGVICGHIHHPAIKTIEGIEYMNSGDWVESMSALCETFEGEWKIISYDQWMTNQVKIELSERKSNTNVHNELEINYA